jgi:hypothetical protein
MMHRFGWQKLLITQVPQGGGGGGGGVAALLSPPDYTPQWNQVIADENAALSLQDKVLAGIKALPAASDVTYLDAVAAINANIDAAIAKIKDAQAVNATIPTSWFGDEESDREANMTTLSNSLQDLQMLRPGTTLTDHQTLALQANKSVILLQQMGRKLGSPIEQEPTGIFPVGSWQYALWQKGYTVNEVYWAEQDEAQKGLMNTYGNNMDDFMNVIMTELDTAIVAKQIPARVDQQTVAPGTNGAGINPLIVNSASRITYTTPGSPIVGVGQGLDNPAAPPTYADPNDTNNVGSVTYYGDDGNTYLHNTGDLAWFFNYVVPNGVGVRLVAPQTVHIVSDPAPALPAAPGIPADNSNPEYRLLQRRALRKNQGWFVSQNPFAQPLPRNPYVDVQSTFQPIVSAPQNPVGWNITGLCGGAGQPQAGVANSHFTPLLMGAGHSPATIDTVRRTLRKTKLAPGADVGAVALQMAQQIDNGVTSSNPAALGNPLASIGGVQSVDPTSDAIIAQSVSAKLQARRARRGLRV